ncbi:hypothetical protein CH341_12430 [Rhodoplanes roseus]|uniref:Ketoreductase domain-containing protein n=2 Tax=Rhodoplanes roseus TaxID=29409 RepID=A0A327KY65_9BRAD|nr:hypothetical protein CH341_12430 [Rhodoplanes roseus]
MPTSAPTRVVVVTGASSGIGRAVAHAFARTGSAVVLAGRSEAPLHETARECRALGGTALVRVTDTSDPDAVALLRRVAVDTFGRIDVWINNAAVLALGRFEDVPEPAFRKVIETNLFGYVYGARAALRQFRQQGSRGVLVNIDSLLGVVTEPHASAYVASKFAIRGLSAALRQELRDTPGIQVCTVLPPSVDTPVYQHAANYTGQRARAIPPTCDPASVARTVLAVAERPRPEVVIGRIARLVSRLAAVAPRTAERAGGRLGPILQFEAKATPPSEGNLFTSRGPHAVRGGWRARGTRLGVRAALGALLIGIPAALVLLRWRPRRPPDHARGAKR